MPTVTFPFLGSRKLEVKLKATSKRPDYSLHFAATIGDGKLTSTALSNGQRVDAFFDGITPLHAAARGGKTTIVHMLVGAGAHVNVVQIPHKLATQQEESGATSGRDTASEFRRAWRSGYTGTEGSTPLHFAAANGHYGVLAFLLEQGADCAKPDKHGITPLVLAESMGQVNAATILRNWADMHPLIHEPTYFKSTATSTPKNLTIKRSLESFFSRSWKGDRFSRDDPKRSRSSASMAYVGIRNRSQISLDTRSNSTGMHTEENRLDPLSHLRSSPLGGRIYQSDSPNSSMLSIGNFIGSRLCGSLSRLNTPNEDDNEVSELSGLPQSMDARETHPDLTARPKEAGLVIPSIASTSPVNLATCPDSFDRQSECSVAKMTSYILRDGPVTENNDYKTHSSNYQDKTVPDRLSLTSHSLLPASEQSSRNSTINKLMPAREIVQHLSKHGCQDLINELDAASFSEYPLSRGGFGDVYRGAFCNGTRVAIKTVRDHVPSCEDSRKTLKHAARELYIWSKCEHPNVLPLLGVVVFRNQLGMVSRWMENGNLLSYLTKNPESDRYKMSTRICEGLVYLHHADVGIIHGDLKGANIVISPEGVPMLTDFGNAVLQEYTLHFTETTQKNGLSVRWTAPELIDDGDTTYSIAADVYALGMTILETITGRVPFFGKSDRAVYAAVMKHKTPDRPKEIIFNGQQDNALWSLLQDCWNPEPARRPSAAEVAKSMSEISRQESTPLVADMGLSLCPLPGSL